MTRSSTRSPSPTRTAAPAGRRWRSARAIPECADIRIEVKLGHDTHAHELASETGCSGDFTVTGADGHGIEANVFTVITANYTDDGNGPAVGVTGSDEAILQPKLKQAEYWSTTGRLPTSTATGDPGVVNETTTDVGGGSAAAFVEDGDWISFNPYNLEDLDTVTFRVASAGAGGTISLHFDDPTSPAFLTSPLITPTGGWQTWKDVTVDLPDTVPTGTHRLFIVFRDPSVAGSLMNLNWFKFTGKGAAVTAPPEVTATAPPDTGEAPLDVAFDATATDAEGEAMTYAWDFGVPGRATRRRSRPVLHLHDAGQLHGDGDGDRRVGRQGRRPRSRSASRGRSTSARPARPARTSSTAPRSTRIAGSVLRPDAAQPVHRVGRQAEPADRQGLDVRRRHVREEPHRPGDARGRVAGRRRRSRRRA